MKSTDLNRACVYLYLEEGKGNPPWGPNGRRGAQEQIRTLAFLTGWTRTRAKNAFERAVHAGYATDRKEPR